MSIGAIYLFVAAALIFGACLFATKKVFPHLHAKQFAIIAMIALLTVGLIWMLLAVTSRKRDDVPLLPTTQPTPLLQPSQD